MSPPRLLALAALLLVAGCGSHSAAEEVRTLASWAATLEMVAQAWSAGDVPRPYAARAVEHARDALAERRQHVDALAAGAREPLAAALGRLDAAATLLAAAVARGDRTEAAALRERVGAETRGLRRLAGAAS